MRDEIKRLADNNSRWVTQDKFYDPSQPPEVCTGNCTEAALASILGIRLDQVPSFQGLVSEDYWDAVYAFVNSRGFDLVMNHRATHYPGLYLADGPSPRGCGHFVVMHDGEMIHDPHPSRAGLLSIEKTWALIPHDPASLASKTDHTEDKLGMVPDGWGIEAHNGGYMVNPPHGPGCWVSGRDDFNVPLADQALAKLCAAMLAAAPAPIVSVRNVTINMRDLRVVIDGVTLRDCDARAFAAADGFTTMEALFAFFRDTYGGETFDGVCIAWSVDA